MINYIKSLFKKKEIENKGQDLNVVRFSERSEKNDRKKIRSQVSAKAALVHVISMQRYIEMLDETDIPTQKAQINLILQQKKDKVFSCGFDVEISKEGIRQAIKELNGY